MDSAAPFTLYFDFTDPISRVVEHVVSAVEADLDRPVSWVGVEAFPFPSPPPPPKARDWAGRLSDAMAISELAHLQWAEPTLVPWSRKAHELHHVAAEYDLTGAVRRQVFDAFFEDGRDIGRIDVLVQLAVVAGMPQMETKAALDVDREEEAVRAAQAQATAAGVVSVPTLVAPWGRIEGFHNGSALRTFLRLP